MSETTYRLVVLAGPEPGQSFSLRGDAITLGRDPVTDIVLDDPEISRQHARLTRTGSGYQVQDLGSTNGSFLDGERLVGAPRDVAPGQTIGLGSTVSLRFEAEEAEPIPDPLGVGSEPEPEAAPEAETTDELAEAAETAAAPEAEPVEGTTPEEQPAVETTVDPFDDPAWREALAPRPMPEFRFDDEGEKAGGAAESATSAAGPATEPEAPSFASYQPEEAPPVVVSAGSAPPPERRRRTWLYVVIGLALVLCCCCALLLLVFYRLGDDFMYSFCRDLAATGGAIPDACRNYLP